MGQTTAEELQLGKSCCHFFPVRLGPDGNAQGEREYQHLQQLLGSSEKELVEELRQACP